MKLAPWQPVTCSSNLHVRCGPTQVAVQAGRIAELGAHAGKSSELKHPFTDSGSAIYLKLKLDGRQMRERERDIYIYIYQYISNSMAHQQINCRFNQQVFVGDVGFRHSTWHKNSPRDAPPPGFLALRSGLRTSRVGGSGQRARTEAKTAATPGPLNGK